MGDFPHKSNFLLGASSADVDIGELTTPPSNHLEKLKGDRKHQWSVRVNDNYRICFEWHNGRACEIEFVDYH